MLAVVMEPVEEVRDGYEGELHCLEVLYPSLHELTIFDGDGGDERRLESQRKQGLFLRVKV